MVADSRMSYDRKSYLKPHLPTSMWPEVFSLKIGESHLVKSHKRQWEVTLINYQEFWEADHWIADNPDQRTYSQARIEIEISGGGWRNFFKQRATLILRPFQLPVVIDGLRIYVETTYQWATQGIAVVKNMTGDVRFSALDATENWGPPDLLFPLKNYRWRSCTYNNTWSALVPYNLLYYHRGDDFGAIEDRLDVIAVVNGTITESPVPTAQDSNTIEIQSSDGMRFRYAHINIETMNPHLTIGSQVQAGQFLGKTGSTWQSKHGADPHLHFGIWQADGSSISSYPFLVDAYLRMYPDAILPVAGGYYFTTPGCPLRLDGSRSIPRPDRAIASSTWRLSNGTTAHGLQTTIRYDRPGCYAEELIVRSDDGQEDWDFAQVRVYNFEATPRQIGYGWLYHSPVRGIKPGDSVRFQPRLVNVQPPVTLDFGDGSPPQAIAAETSYAYAKPGIYIVTLTTSGPANDPVTLKMRVIVEP